MGGSEGRKCREGPVSVKRLGSMNSDLGVAFDKPGKEKVRLVGKGVPRENAETALIFASKKGPSRAENTGEVKKKKKKPSGEVSTRAVNFSTGEAEGKIQGEERVQKANLTHLRKSIRAAKSAGLI